MTTLTDVPTDLEVREFHVREVAQDRREFTGIAVPWGEQTDRVGGLYREVFERGAVVDSDSAIVFYRHGEPIGKVTSAQDTDAGWEVTGTLSDTTLAREAYTLLRDGVITALSVGFAQLPGGYREESGADGRLTITRTKVQVREVSLTPFPAYAGAAITDVRHAQPTKENPPMTATAVEPTTVTSDQLAEVRESVETVSRAVANLAARETPTEPEMHYRSAGALLKAIVAGEDLAIREYSDTLKRAWEGGTTADTVVRKGWVGDLTRIIDEPSNLRALFSTGPLPAEGNYLEYAELLANTVQVGKQAAEGDDLAFGKVSLTTKSAPIATYGGYTSLTRQEIERSSVNVLDASLRALAIAANKALNAAFRAHYAAALAAQLAAGNKVVLADLTYTAWVGAIVDAAIKYEDLALPIDALVADPTVFKILAGLTDLAGRPLMTVSGQGVNAVGTINPKALSGDLAGVTVRLNAKQAAPGAGFVNGDAIRQYSSPLARLQDENVVNLSKDFSVYMYSALANEIPSAIVAVQLPA